MNELAQKTREHTTTGPNFWKGQKYETVPVSPRILRIKERRSEHDNGHVILCGERTKIYTDYYKAHEDELPILKRAGALYDWCAKKVVRLEEDEMFVGNLGTEWRSAEPYVEWGVWWIEDALNLPRDVWVKEWQSPGVFAYISPEDEEVYREAVEYWKTRCIQAHAHTTFPDELWDLLGDNCTSFGNRGKKFTADMPEGHYCPNYRKIIEVGWGGVRDEADGRIQALMGKVFNDDAARFTFWRAMKKVAEGAILLTQRYAELVRAAWEQEPAGARKDELRMMADGLAWIATNPARTWWEGLQQILVYQLMLHADGQSHAITLGRIDQYVGYMLDADLADGMITRERAQEIADAFVLKLGDYFSIMKVFSGERGTLATKSKYSYVCGGQHFTLGGKKKDGSDATNALTLLFLQTYRRLYLADPSLSVRVHPDTPYEVWEAAIESSKTSGGMPIIENDEIIIPALVERGMSQEDANDYCIIGCVEPAGCGTEWSACGSSGAESFCNLMGILNMALHNGTNPKTGCSAGVKTGYLYDYKAFDDLKEAFLVQLKFFLDWHISMVNLYELAYSIYFPCVSASVTIEGCMESGKDVLDGGAKYNSTGFTACGTGNVADSLIAIKKLVFDEKTVSAQELYDALMNNWVGYEDLQAKINNEVPHYGNNIAEADELAAWALGAFADHMNAARGPRGKWRGGTFTMTTHIEFGNKTMATPDGREDFMPLAEAISSRQGYDKNGPTAYLTSASKLPHYKLGNGDQLNIRFSPKSVAGELGTRRLQELFDTYFDMGGMQVQFNVVAADTLYEAQEHPEDYENLIVRIAGFSAFFVEMPKPLQDDFITRSEHVL
jgi:formate C-acetyltransferase